MISIIIPAYNVEKFIGKALDSLLAQTHNDLEIIVVNDGSKDGTKQTVEAYAERSPKIVLVNVENGGVSRARNIGMDHAKGKYIAFLDADDEYLPDAMKNMYDCMEQYQADLCATGHCCSNRRTEIITTAKSVVWSPQTALQNVLDDHLATYSACAKMYRADKLRENAIRFPEGKHIHEDSFFVFCCIATFGVIASIEGYVFTVSTAINGMFLPRIAKITAEDQQAEKLNALLLTVGKFQFIVTGLIIAAFIVVGREFIELWVGPEYQEAYIDIVLVILPGLFYNALQIAHTTLIVENKVKIRAGVELLTGILNVIFSFVLSYRFGVLGAALSIFMAYTIRVLVLLFVYRKVLHIDIWQFITKCYLRMSLPLSICIVVGLGLNTIWHTNAWISLASKGIVIVVVYIIAMFSIAFSRQDRKALWGWIKK